MMSNQCETCEGSGVHLEEREHGTHESLACLDCQGTGLIPERDDLHIKYRVFREPQDTTDDHPVEMTATYEIDDGFNTAQAEELTRFVFVLVPESDYHARVAIAAYAASVERDRPALASDLMDVLAMGWGG